MAIFGKESIANNTGSIIPNATLYHLGVLQSAMHIAWVSYVCGRLKSDYRYSNEIVYNNFPWPEKPTDKQKVAIENAIKKVLDARKQFSDNTLADLYDPVKMPAVLVKAHIELNKAVDLAYRSQPFTNDASRMVYLFERYEKYSADLFTKEKPKKTKTII